MSYFGAAPTGNFISTASQRVTGSTNNYVDLDHAISALSDVIILVNSVKQDITNLTFTSASRITLGGTLVSSDVVEIVYLGKSVATQTPGTGTVTNDMLAGSIALDKLSATGTKSSSTFLRGDNTFATAGISGVTSSSSSTALNIDSSGHVTHPLTSGFVASPTSNSATINADTTYTIIAGTEIIDRNADWNTSNGTFTAPVTGLYHLSISIQIQNYDYDNNYSAIFILTSNRRYTPWLLNGNQFDSNGSFYITGSCIADMDANDTAQFQFRHDQGASSQVLVGQEFTFVGGYLLG